MPIESVPYESRLERVLLLTGSHRVFHGYDIPPQEVAELYKLYTQTGGPSWINHANWFENKTCANWFGLTVAGGRVTKIELSGNGLSAQLPNISWGVLGAIQVIDLSDNSLSESSVNYALEVIYASRESFSYSGPSLDITGNNAAPTGAGLAAEFNLIADPIGEGFSVWDVKSSAAYYVDSVAGNDANDGLSATTAVKTLSQLMALDTSAPLDRWNLVSGSHWREGLAVPRNGVCVYGLGANKPVIDGSDVVNAGAFSDIGGNVYQFTHTVNCYWVNVFEDGSYLTRVADETAVAATQGSYCVSAETGAITVHIHATDSSNPSANGKAYEITARDHCVNAYSVDGIRVFHIDSMKTGSAYGEIQAGEDAIVYDCNARYGARHNIIVKSGLMSAVDGSYLYCGTIDTSLFVAYTNGNADGLEATLLNCSGSYHEALRHNLAVGYYSHAATGNYAKSSLTGCTFSDIGGGGISCANHLLLDINSCILDNVDTAFGGTAVENVALDCVATGLRIGVSLVGSANWDIRDSEFEVTGTSNNSGVIYSINGNGNEVKMSGCTVTAAQFWNIWITNTAANMTFELLRNTLALPAVAYYEFKGGNGHTVVSDYNTFPSGSVKFRMNGVEYLNLAAWQAAGYDAHSVVAS